MRNELYSHYNDAQLSDWVGVTIAHELGHNLGLGDMVQADGDTDNLMTHDGSRTNTYLRANQWITIHSPY